MSHDKSQSTAYELCGTCGHFKHLHGDVHCYGTKDCNCAGFVEMKNVRVEEVRKEGKGQDVVNQQAVEDYREYLSIIKVTVENYLPQVRVVDKDYGEEVARRIVNVLDSNGWAIKRK